MHSWLKFGGIGLGGVMLAFLLGAGGGGERPDPVKTNGAIFTDWAKPDLSLVLTGEQDGYLEPCGCAGLTNQKGGLKRRQTFLNQLMQRGWNPVPLDAGGQIRRYGPQAQIKYRRSLESLIDLGYRGIGFGTNDLRMDLLGVIINLDESTNPLTSANIGIFEFDETFSRRWRTVTEGGIKVGFTSVLGPTAMQSVGSSDDVTITDPVEALTRVTAELEQEKCDQLVLLVYGDAAEATELSRQFPQYQWVVAGVGADEPPHQSKAITTEAGEKVGAQLVEVGHKGMYAVVIGIYADGSRPRYQKVPLDHRFEDSEPMQQMMKEYQEELRTLGLDTLGAKPQLHPSTPKTGGKFVGSAVCNDCHDTAYEKWSKTPHAHATQTLVDLDPPRHFDPECLSCHVTGWNAQKYYPYTSGYKGLEATPHLTANGCENCHGPGGKHAAAEMGDIAATEAELASLRDAMRLEIQPNEGNKEGQVLNSSTKAVNICLQCHDLDNSPDFDFQAYWPEVEHGED